MSTLQSTRHLISTQPERCYSKTSVCVFFNYNESKMQHMLRRKCLMSAAHLPALKFLYIFMKMCIESNPLPLHSKQPTIAQESSFSHQLSFESRKQMEKKQLCFIKTVACDLFSLFIFSKFIR